MADDPARLGQAIGSLEITSKKNEHELVIEFATDRILHYVGVYLVAFIAVVAKISELAATSLTCYPAGNISVSGDFIKYANSYCWESSNVMSQSNSSIYVTDNTPVVIDDPATFMTIFRVLPYVMLLEAVLYALPSMFWHARVGAKLMGHLRFMRNLLTDVYEDVRKIPTGSYVSEDSYDSKSYYLNDWNGFDPKYVQQQVRDERGAEESEQLLDTMNRQEEQLRQLVFGNMRDRHFFSMLCFENFSSLEHHPYILSVYKLTDFPGESPDDSFTGPIMKAILRLQCQKKNFGGQFLVTAYFCRHVIGTMVSLTVVLAMCTILSWINQVGWHADSFRCDIPFHDEVLMTCTIIRRLDMIAYLIVNLAVSLLYFLISVFRIGFIRWSKDRAIYHYFDEISDTGSAALWAASLIKSREAKRD